MEGEGYDQHWDEEDDEWDENPSDERGGVASNSRSYSESSRGRHGVSEPGERSRSPAASEKSTGFGRAGTVKKNLNRSVSGLL